MSKKTFIIDTNVLLHDPVSLFMFEENYVVIPLVVIEEIDKHKNRNDEVGRNAREVTRKLDKLRKRGSLSKGIKLNNGGTLCIQSFNMDEKKASEYFYFPDSADNRIILAAQQLIGEGVQDVTVVTKDINVRIKCDVLNVPCDDYLRFRVVPNSSQLYTGTKEIELLSSDIDDLYAKGSLTLSKSSYPDILATEFILAQTSDSMGNTKSALARCTVNHDLNELTLKPIKQNYEAWGIKKKNNEQLCALNLLSDDDIKLVTLVGKAGTGKTLLAVASGLQQTIERGKYDKLIISRPVQPMGRDIGYLPGTLEEKMQPWIAPIMDNMKFLFKDFSNREDTMQMYFDRGIIEIEALTYIRGRSIPNAYIIIDEAQNLSPHELKTIVTRAGVGTKIVLTGDIEQIDNQFIDSVSNGLTYAVEKFKQHNIAGHITLTKGERSDLASLASEIL